jgi:hypothetical protein
MSETGASRNRGGGHVHPAYHPRLFNVHPSPILAVDPHILDLRRDRQTARLSDLEELPVLDTVYYWSRTTTSPATTSSTEARSSISSWTRCTAGRSSTPRRASVR